jgi:hypothetical protein
MTVGIASTEITGFITQEIPERPETNDPFTINEDGTIDLDLSGKARIRKTLQVDQNLQVLGDADIDGDLIVDNRIGIGTTQPQQRLDVAGSIKIDENIYDSVNSPAKNGYFLSRDQSGIRWIPLISEPIGNGVEDIIGVGTAGIFVLDEGVPLYPN